MDSQSTTELIQLLTYILIPIVIAIFGLIIFLVFLKIKENKKSNNNEEVNSKVKNTATSSTVQNRQSIFNFMEFDNIEDSMIIQKNGNRYLMVIGCQGVNYDLMSAVEKNSVEEGFVQFLNTLRNPIQIYIQTRSINLERSLEIYRQKIKDIDDKYKNMEMRFEQMKKSGNYREEQLSRAYFELTKQANLREYGNSIIQDTEKMSLNKNILSKSYYIVVPYFSTEAGNDKLDKEEIKNIAFSELYTRCQSLIASISVCGVRGKILKSNELVELLYMAYNRDEAETFGLDRALKAGFGELYSTAPDVYQKKIKILDKEIEEKALLKAREKVNEARSEIQKQAEEKANNTDTLIDEIAKMILEQNEEYIGTEVKNKAIKKIEEETKEGGKSNGKKARRNSEKTTI